jgi:hypothetical protein
VAREADRELAGADLDALRGEEVADPVEDRAVRFLLRPPDAGVVIALLGRFEADAAVTVGETGEVGPES